MVADSQTSSRQQVLFQDVLGAGSFAVVEKVKVEAVKPPLPGLFALKRGKQPRPSAPLCPGASAMLRASHFAVAK